MWWCIPSRRKVRDVEGQDADGSKVIAVDLFLRRFIS
jgi:hypothetical protein